MTSIPPYRIRVPLLLGGPDARDLEAPLAALGFVASVASDRLGVASATKMCRSVMIKGLEAMVIESFTAARHYGVEDAVVASLHETFPGIDWERQAAYFFQRAIEHGRRRAEEMREAAETMREAGLAPWSAAGTAERQAWVADLGERACSAAATTPASRAAPTGASRPIASSPHARSEHRRSGDRPMIRLTRRQALSAALALAASAAPTPRPFPPSRFASSSATAPAAPSTSSRAPSASSCRPASASR